MVGFAARQPAEMAAAHSAGRPGAPAAASAHDAAMRRRNLRAVLDMGTTQFFAFRGRAYGVPPLPWRAGEQLSRTWAEAVELGELNGAGGVSRYYDQVARLPGLIWANVRPVGRVWRLLRWLRLARNPFETATEQELVDLAGFLLRCRTRSGVQHLSAPATRPSI
jgi:hypothetical protein